MRSALLAGIVACVLCLQPAAAQTPATDATLSHSALKGLTFKASTIIANLVIMSGAAGNVVGGVGLTAFVTAASWAVYTVNDYLWDSYAPPPADRSFDAADTAWRTTKKFLTYKPTVIVMGWAAIYAYTGSATTMLVFGTASTLSKTALFYVNNFAWDYYDWYTSPRK